MTPQQEALAALRDVLQDLDKAEIKTPTMPMDAYVQEAAYLYKWCLVDRAELEAAGLDWSLVEGLPQRIDAAREAQSCWHDLMFGQQEAMQIWKRRSPEGYDLRDTMLHYARYAYRNMPEMTARIGSVAEGDSDADMIQDLNDLAVIVRENPDPLAAVGFDLSTLDRAAAISAELSGIRAEASVDRADLRAEKDLRDRAYTHLKDAVDTIRDCGRFVFWRNDDRRRGYRSEYERQRRLQYEAQQPTPTVTEAPAPA